MTARGCSRAPQKIAVRPDARSRSSDPRAPAGRWRRSPSCCAGGRPRSAAARRAVDDALELVGRAEEERPVDAEDRHVVGNGLVLQDVQRGPLRRTPASPRSPWSSPHPPDEQQRREHHADLDRDGEIGEHRERERRSARRRCRSWSAQQLRNLAPLAHVVGDDKRIAGEHGHRNVPGERRGKEQDGQQRQRVNHARDRRARARADIGRRARDRARRRQAAEERRR